MPVNNANRPTASGFEGYITGINEDERKAIAAGLITQDLGDLEDKAISQKKSTTEIHRLDTVKQDKHKFLRVNEGETADLVTDEYTDIFVYGGTLKVSDITAFRNIKSLVLSAGSTIDSTTALPAINIELEHQPLPYVLETDLAFAGFTDGSIPIFEHIYELTQELGTDTWKVMSQDATTTAIEESKTFIVTATAYMDGDVKKIHIDSPSTYEEFKRRFDISHDVKLKVDLDGIPLYHDQNRTCFADLFEKNTDFEHYVFTSSHICLWDDNHERVAVQSFIFYITATTTQLGVWPDFVMEDCVRDNNNPEYYEPIISFMNWEETVARLATKVTKTGDETIDGVKTFMKKIKAPSYRSNIDNNPVEVRGNAVEIVATEVGTDTVRSKVTLMAADGTNEASLFPWDNGVLNLGNSAQQYKDLYLSGNIHGAGNKQDASNYFRIDTADTSLATNEYTDIFAISGSVIFDSPFDGKQIKTFYVNKGVEIKPGTSSVTKINVDFEEKTLPFTADDKMYLVGRTRNDCMLFHRENSVVLTSPNNTKYKIKVSDDGTLSTESI